MLFGSCKHNNLFTEYTKKRQHDKHDPCYMQYVKSYSMISNTFLLEFQKNVTPISPWLPLQDIVLVLSKM